MISFGKQKIFSIEEQSDIAAARRACTQVAQTLAFNETRIGELSLVLTEAATNIIKHAKHGHIVISPCYFLDNIGIEILAVDAGPGIENLDFHMTDGNSSTGTYGLGLGSMRRIAHDFSIYAEHGTAVRMLIWKNTSQLPDEQWQCGAVCVPIHGEEACGDAWGADTDGNLLTLVVADGLGHGPEAAMAADAAIATVINNKHDAPLNLLTHANNALQGTRGAALAIAQIDEEKNRLDFAGIGNISVTLFNPESRHHLVSLNGIVGTQLRKTSNFSQPWQPGATLIAHSDGVATRWNLDHYPNLARAHPSLIAAILHRDFARGRDDATVVVIRHQQVN